MKPNYKFQGEDFMPFSGLTRYRERIEIYHRDTRDSPGRKPEALFQRPDAFRQYHTGDHK